MHELFSLQRKQVLKKVNLEKARIHEVDGKDSVGMYLYTKPRPLVIPPRYDIIAYYVRAEYPTHDGWLHLSFP
uniref:UBC core domain-containing protein n=1 Tax=Caenorhabditis tropicalis TaxID=1561998 RepID=A0A1I7U6Z0_9PELO